MVNEVLRTDIPNDWDVITLGDYAQIFRGGSPRPIQAFLTTSDQGINWIKIGDVGAGEKFIESTEEKIIPEGVSRSRMVYKGDLILSNSMSYGRPYIMNIEGCIHDGWLVIQKYDRLFNREYLYYALSSDLTMRQYVAMAAGSSVQNLNKEKVSKIVLPCPKILEQKKIAEVLSSIDTLIVDLKKLIRKKKDIRQGTMQMLLTGKKRLEGFSGDWIAKPLEKLCDLITDGSHESPSEYLDGFYMPSVKDMTDSGFVFSDCKRISKADYERLVANGCKPEIGDVLIAKDGSMLKYVFPVKEKRNIVILSSIAILRPKKNMLSSSYLTYYFRQPRFVEQVIKSNQTGTGVPRIVLKNFKKIELNIPEELNEQEAIAGILSDMDIDIWTLKKKLKKLTAIKQGMMEELLTGKVRLM